MKFPTIPYAHRSVGVRAAIQTVGIGLLLALAIRLAGHLFALNTLDSFYREPVYSRTRSVAAWPLELQLTVLACVGIVVTLVHAAYRAPRLLRPVSPALTRHLLTVLIFCAFAGTLYTLLRISLAWQSCLDLLLPDSPRCPPSEVLLVGACVLAVSFLTLLLPSLLALLLAMFGFLPIRTSPERWLGLLHVVALPLLVSAMIRVDGLQLVTLPIILVIYLAAMVLAPLTFRTAST